MPFAKVKGVPLSCGIRIPHERTLSTRQRNAESALNHFIYFYYTANDQFSKDSGFRFSQKKKSSHDPPGCHRSGAMTINNVWQIINLKRGMNL